MERGQCTGGFKASMGIQNQTRGACWRAQEFVIQNWETLGIPKIKKTTKIAIFNNASNTCAIYNTSNPLTSCVFGALTSRTDAYMGQLRLSSYLVKCKLSRSNQCSGGVCSVTVLDEHVNMEQLLLSSKCDVSGVVLIPHFATRHLHPRTTWRIEPGA